ncbi:MAG: glycosyltransferase [Acidobacteriota bacterium]
MSRFLFVVPPLVGHTNPTVSVARHLASRGHDVAWVAHPGKVRPLLPAGARLFALPEQVDADHARAVGARAKTARGAAALKFLWEDFLVPLARQMQPGIAAAVDEFRPDVLAVDQQAVAGGLVARRSGLPWATLATTSAGVIDPLAALPAVKQWHRELIAELERDAGLLPADHAEISPHLVLAFTTEALCRGTFPAHYRFVGPSISDRPETTPFPFEQLRRPSVLVSMGTVNAEASGRFYEVTMAALRDEPVQVVLVAPPELAPDPPASFVVRAYVPQLALLEHVDAVVCHGGHNTTCEALAHGLPLVIAPIKDDQPIVADQVVAAGAGLRVKFGRVQPGELRDAVRRVRTEASFREAAARVRASFAAAGGADAAARALEALAEVRSTAAREAHLRNERSE